MSDTTPPSTPTPPAVTPTSQPQPAPRSPSASKTPLYEAHNAGRYARQHLIRDINDSTGTKLICYVSRTLEIDRGDPVALIDLLHNIPLGTPIDLLLHSPGGDIDAAEKLITLIRKRAGTAGVRVIVPDYAKSAATLIALGADTIVMSDSSELGAIDPQIALPDSNGHLVQLSAQSYLDAYRRHAEQLTANPADPVARLMLAKLDPALVTKLERMVKRSRAIAEDLLTQAMIKDPADAATVATELSDTERWYSHGQMISHENLTGLGVNITYHPPTDPAWQNYWRLYCAQAFDNDPATKLFESDYASLPIT